MFYACLYSTALFSLLSKFIIAHFTSSLKWKTWNRLQKNILFISFLSDAAAKLNGTFKIEETLPQYFHGEVLQRNLASNNTHYGTIKFQVAFNLAVVWMIVFVALSKGLRSYGKVIWILFTTYFYLLTHSAFAKANTYYVAIWISLTTTKNSRFILKQLLFVIILHSMGVFAFIFYWYPLT